jgi:hypothetical protein
MKSGNQPSGGVNLRLIEEFDKFLKERGLSFQCIVAGAASLILLDIIDRGTKDCDVLDPKIPEDIKRASVDFASMKNNQGYDLPEDWLNNGPESLMEVLPASWRKHTRLIYDGEVIQLYTLSRLDLLRSKLFGLCDRGTDLEDCISLSPSDEELNAVIDWVKKQDANPMWPDHVDEQFGVLRERLSAVGKR